jgi:hypothetical protein
MSQRSTVLRGVGRLPIRGRDRRIDLCSAGDDQDVVAVNIGLEMERNGRRSGDIPELRRVGLAVEEDRVAVPEERDHRCLWRPVRRDRREPGDEVRFEVFACPAPALRLERLAEGILLAAAYRPTSDRGSITSLVSLRPRPVHGVPGDDHLKENCHAAAIPCSFATSVEPE